MSDETIGQIAIYFSFVFFVGIALLLIYVFFTGDTSFIGSSGTANDCVPNPVWGGCDM